MSKLRQQVDTSLAAEEISAAPPGDVRAPVTSTPGWRWEVAAIVSAVIETMFVPAFMCTCGHLPRAAFLVTVPALVISSMALFASRQSLVLARFLRVAAVVVAALWFLKNAADVLWFGHDPVFRSMPLWLLPS